MPAKAARDGSDGISPTERDTQAAFVKCPQKEDKPLFIDIYISGKKSVTADFLPNIYFFLYFTRPQMMFFRIFVT